MAKTSQQPGGGLDLLAAGAEAGAPTSQEEALNGGAADGAGLAFPVGDLEIKVGGAQLTAGADIGIGAGSLPGDSLAEDALDGAMDFLDFPRRQALRGS